MAGKTLIGGTAYTIKGGKTKVNGTNYSIKQGKVLINGTSRNITFLSDPVALIPVMTSNTTPSGVVSASSSWDTSTYLPYKAFSNDFSKIGDFGWCPANKQHNGAWIQYQFANTVIPTSIAIKPRVSGSYGPYARAFEVKISNDGSNWQSLLSDNVPNTKDYISYPTYNLNNVNSCKYIRIVFTGEPYNGQGYIQINVIQVYGHIL